MKRTITLILCLALVVTMSAGCTKGGGGANTTDSAKSTTTDTKSTTAAEETNNTAATENKKGTIKFGVLAPITGTYAEYGKGFKVATKMAIDEINSAGGANGYMLELDVQDSQGDATISSDLCRSFCDNKEVMAIIGDFTSGACMANAPIVDEAGIVQLSPTASNTEYAAMSEYCFSIMGRQDGEAPFFAEKICKEFMGASSVGIIYINSDWGSSAFKNFKIKADQIGLEIAEAVSFVKDETDYSSLITRLKAANPEILVLMGQSEVALIINQIKATGWDIPITTLGPGPSQQLLDNCGKNAEGLVVTLAFYFDPENKKIMEWKNKFVAEAGFNPTTHPVVAYDCVYLLAEAIKMCGDGEVTRKAIRDNLAKVDFQGMAGKVVFNPAGDIYRSYMITVVKDGEFKVQK